MYRLAAAPVATLATLGAELRLCSHVQVCNVSLPITEIVNFLVDSGYDYH